MHDEPEKTADKLEKETKFTIIRMEDDEDDVHKANILRDAENEVTKLFTDFRLWLKRNVRTDEVDRRLEKLKYDCAELLHKTKQNLHHVYQNEHVQDGKERLVHTGKKVKACMDEGVQDVLENPYVHQTMQTLRKAVDDIREDEHVRRGVKTFKKGTLQAAQCVFDGLKRVLDTNEDDEHKEDDSQKGSDL